MPRFRKPFSRPYFSQGFVEIRTLHGVGPRAEWRELEVSTNRLGACLHAYRKATPHTEKISDALGVTHQWWGFFPSGHSILGPC